jgi:hypothetical protein
MQLQVTLPTQKAAIAMAQAKWLDIIAWSEKPRRILAFQICGGVWLDSMDNEIAWLHLSSFEES